VGENKDLKSVSDSSQLTIRLDELKEATGEEFEASCSRSVEPLLILL
jgi:hypothetical protein